MIGVDKNRGYTQEGKGRRANRLDCEGRSARPEPTVRKYVRMKDLSPEPRGGASPRARSSRHTRRRSTPGSTTTAGTGAKQRHTATRVYVRLRDEEGYTGSYSTVQRYVKRRREEMAARATAGTPRGS